MASELFSTADAITDVINDTAVWTISVVDVAYCIIALLGIIGNGMVLFVFFRVRQLRTTTNILIRHQALVDFISSLLLPVTFVPPERNLGMLQEQKPFLASVICRIWYSKYLFWTFIKISTTNLVFLTLERYFAVLHPHRYRKRASTRNLILVCASAWLIGATIEVYFPLINNIYDDGECTTRDFTPDRRAPIGYISLLTTLVIPVIVMIFVYTSIIRFLRRHKANLAVHKEHPSASNCNVSSVISVQTSTPPMNRRSVVQPPPASTLMVPHYPDGHTNDGGLVPEAEYDTSPRRRSVGELSSEHSSQLDLKLSVVPGVRTKDRGIPNSQPKAYSRPKSTGDASFEPSSPIALSLAVPAEVVTTPSDDDKVVKEEKKKTRKSRTSAEMARRNIVVTMFIVCVTYIVCWTPDILLYWHHNVVILHDWKEPFHRFAILLAFANVCTNPIIYTLKYRSFQNGLKTVFGRQCRVC